MTRPLDQAGGDLYRALVECAADAIIFADREGLIRLWNSGSEALFGYAASEVIGQSLDIIIPERLRRAHWDGYRSALAAGHTLHGRHALPTRSMHRNGSRLYVELSFSVVKDAQGTVIGAMSIGRDITARYLKEHEHKARADGSGA
ncbi:MAG: PAS domain S-box protein [Betaproteobacteria bacterium]|nr:PAS domain S-box protein [Betaproteobacteria bacterium]